MAVPAVGPYYIVLAGRGTAQTATLYYGPKPVISNTYASTDLLGPYTSLSSAEAELKNLTITGGVTVGQYNSNGSTSVLGSVDISTGGTSSTAAPVGSSEPSNPTGAIQAEGGNVAPSITNPLDFLGEIGDFFNALTQKNTWIRIAKVVIGGSLLIIGIAHMTGAEDVVSRTARKVPIIV